MHVADLGTVDHVKLGGELRERGAANYQSAVEGAAGGADAGNGEAGGGVWRQRLGLRSQGAGTRGVAVSHPQPEEQHDRCHLHLVRAVAIRASLRSSQQNRSQ